MPMAGSIIAGDIVLLALARDDGDAARVKDFHLSLHYSEDRVSQVLKELVRDGWLTMERDEDDRRMRKVHASDRLRLLFGEYRRFLFEMLADPEQVRGHQVSSSGEYLGNMPAADSPSAPEKR